MSIRRAAREFNIPRVTIHNKLNNKHSNTVGAPTIFAPKKEEFASRLIVIRNCGFPLDKFDLRMLVAAYLSQQGRDVKQFPNTIPGSDWASSSMRRWELTHRPVSNICRKRAKITKVQVQAYFEKTMKEIDGIPASSI